MSLLAIRKKLLRFHVEDDGAAMTEFILFLPIWITVFIGIINLGKVGIFTTKIQLQAQRDLWSKAIQVTEGFEGEFMSPRVAAIDTGGKYGTLAANGLNDQQVNDGVEAALVGVTMETYGHFGESAEKSNIPLGPFVPDDVRLKYSPKEILGQDDAGRYPHLLVNDTLAEANFSGSGVASILASVFAASGLVQSVGAGIRYGAVFADKEETQQLIAGHISYKAGAHYDTLVPPRALKTLEGEGVPFAIAFIMFKTDEKYEHYLQFGKENWGGGFGAADTPSDQDWEANNTDDDEIEKQCKEKKNNCPAQCEGYSESGCGENGNDPCGSKPSWWDKC